LKRLPTGFELLGNKIKVEQVDNLSTIGDRYGDWHIKSNTVRIQSRVKGVPDDVVFATFYHELVHAALDLIGHSKLSEDEEFVERLGQVLYQAEKTRTYK
jgi:hypothetical protein